MTDDRLQLTRRKILASVGAVGLAGAGAGLGTSAYFNDEEAFEGNSMTAGALDLKVDWQQQYWGPENADAPVYGDAGRPWVNAHPDHDGDGIQSLDTTEFDSVPDEGVVTYEEAGGNIQRSLTCETLDHDYDFGDREALVELHDLKPGDRGEITFSYHLCDNDGYVWFCGERVGADENGVTEPEGESDLEQDEVVELLDAINVQVWYDVNCDNQFDDDDETEVLAGSPTTLRTFLNAFEEGPQNCLMLNPGVYPGINPTTGCEELDRIDFSSDGLSVDGAGEVVRVEDGDPNDSNDNLEVWVYLEDPGTSFGGAVIHFDDMWTVDNLRPNSVSDLGDIKQFDWTLVDEVVGDNGDTYTSDDYGMCELVITDDQDERSADLIGQSCSTGENNVVVPNGGSFVQAVRFSYCDPSQGDSQCFPGGQTFCLGFEWWVPETVGNEIQSDAVAFDLGFYTEQCRHNDDPAATLEPPV